MLTVFKRSCLILAAAMVVGAAGCQPAQRKPEVQFKAVPTMTQAVVNIPNAEAGSTAQPTEDLGGYPVGLPGAETAYPAGDAGSPPGAETAYPAGDVGYPPAAAPAVENQSKVTAKLIEAAPGPDNSGLTRLHVQVLSSEALNGMPDFTSKLINQEADLYVQTEQMPQMSPGDQFSATVSYNGDENGGKYMVVEIGK